MPVASVSSTFVLDNGACSLKAGYSSWSSPNVIPNSITKAKSEKRRIFIGNQIDECRDLSSLYFMLPFQKGYLTNWDYQKQIWDYMYGKQCLNVDTPSKNLVFTEPYFNFLSIQEGLSELFFEEYRFKNVFRTHPGDLTCYKNKMEHPEEPCCLVVDSGYSFTHIVPYVDGKRVRNATKRIDVGGKLLTNHLKEIISYRQLHVMDETYVMNACREDCCYVSLDFERDLTKAESRTESRDYVLPDFTNLRRGFMKSPEASNGRPEDSEQIIRMNNERFAVPEILFHPSDIGIQQMGIPETIAHVISECPEETQRWLYQNIVLTGGLAKMPGFRERILKDVRELAPNEFKVIVRLPEDPISYAWQGGAALADDPIFRELSVSKLDYQERGHQACVDKYYL
ncbi:hypothetical protein TCAL_07010 [Tigriopus californicus]|uniref:Actin-related protein 6 n=1 Tax=Tigriopus californicus TaxID=6832 RepID=A0A553PBI6_TIGCA|nr:actin-related protein 6-like [Tigriopus californicus]TRY75044.1 hypothetical protein TCAL_07010 [Tigriopus californicus]